MGAVNFRNRTLFHGDNLNFLRGMNGETVHLIATDPPFNKSKDFHATPDSLAKGAKFQDRWRWTDEIDVWTNKLQDDYPHVYRAITSAHEVYGSDMGAFLAFMGVRLIEMRRVLREDGSIYLHCDHTAHAYLKTLMDAVFGRKNFRNEIVWCYKSGGASPKRHFSRKNDSILWYTKSDRYSFNPQTEKSYNRDLKPYRFAGVAEYQDDVGWYALVGMKDYWDIAMVGRTSGERLGYPTQKPLALYERIIEASSNSDDVVLDPFCGCATTPIAAERLGRRWIGMDIWDGAHEIVLRRLELEHLAVPEESAEGQPNLITFGEVRYSTTNPVRTDEQTSSVAYLHTPTGRGRRYPPPRKQHGKLVAEFGPYCQGCGADYNFDHRVLEFDYVMPKSDGGTDAYQNLTLLCPPCNQVKRDYMTLTGLQRENRRSGHMKPGYERRISRGRGTRRRRARR